MEEVNRLSALKDEKINEAKSILAYEVTKLVHGQEAADAAQKQAQSVFGGSTENIPSIKVENMVGRKLLDVLVENKIIGSKGEGRRLIAQNGLTVGDEKVTDIDKTVDAAEIVVKVGKKKFYKLIKGE